LVSNEGTWDYVSTFTLNICCPGRTVNSFLRELSLFAAFSSRPLIRFPAMGWTLLLADSDGVPLEESSTTLDDELVEYFGRLEGFPALRAFLDLPSDGETPLPAGVREALEGEIAELAARTKRRELPDPPEWVGLEGTGDIRLGEELGWRGLLDFLQRLEHLLFLARQMGMELWAEGED
jgi:hypothetical protein